MTEPFKLPSRNESTLLEDIEKLRELSKPTISQQEAETCQNWAQLDGSTAFHLIERHAASLSLSKGSAE